MHNGAMSAQIERVANAQIDRSGVPGASVAMVADGGPVISLGLGFRYLDRRSPLAADDRFLLYSVTKTLIAVAALRLVEAGRLDLDQPAREVLPGIPLEPGVTVRRLLNHTAGIGDYGGMPEYTYQLRAHPGTPWTDEDYLERVLSRGPLFRPGEGWAYSNVGYLLLRRVVEHLSGASLRKVLEQELFTPLALWRTAVVERLSDTTALTPAWSSELDDGDALRDVSRRYHPGWVSHGVAMSTAAEAAGLLEALFEARLLRPESLGAMLAPVEVPGRHPLFSRPGYGLGMMIERDTARWHVAGHGGGGPGYSAAAFHFRAPGGARLTAVALANRDVDEVAMRIVFAVAERWGAAAE